MNRKFYAVPMALLFACALLSGCSTPEQRQAAAKKEFYEERKSELLDLSKQLAGQFDDISAPLTKALDEVKRLEDGHDGTASVPLTENEKLELPAAYVKAVLELKEKAKSVSSQTVVYRTGTEITLIAMNHTDQARMIAEKEEINQATAQVKTIEALLQEAHQRLLPISQEATKVVRARREAGETVTAAAEQEEYGKAAIAYLKGKRPPLGGN